MIQLLVINDPSYKAGPQTVNGIEFQVTVADAALKALNEIIHISPDAIILNMENHGMDARQVFTRIRNMQASKKVPVLLFCELEHEMDVRAMMDDGITDYFTMPVTQYEAFGWVVKKLGAEKPSEQKSILIVDDDPVVLDLSKLYLGGKYRVVTFNNASSALAKLKVFKPDIILLDIAMPEMDGMTLLQEIRSIPERSRIPIIFQTGMAGMKTVRECVRLGAAGFVIKPIKKDNLLEKIEETFKNIDRLENMKRIFVFEEFDFMYQLIEGYAKDTYDVIRGESVTASMNHFEEIAPQYVILDLDNSSFMLPRVKDKCTEMKVPIILLTKDLGSNTAQKERQRRNTYFLQTPIKKEHMLDLLNSIGEWSE